MPKRDPLTWFSVDVETAGPDPLRYSLLSIGACLVSDPERTFYVELKPVNMSGDPRALAISGLSMEELAQTGQPPAEAMRSFAEWVEGAVPEGSKPLFVAFNAPFDWMFVNSYFHVYLGRNPFGHSALDMKAFYMALTGVTWAETGMHAVAHHYGKGLRLSHHALRDAQDQAGLFREMLREAETLREAKARQAH